MQSSVRGEAIAQAFDKVDPATLHSRLVTFAKSADEDELDALHSLLFKVSRESFNDRTQRFHKGLHCVRCHRGYTVGDNQGCQLCHLDGTPVRLNGIYRNICERCGETEVMESRDIIMMGLCFDGRHTTDVNLVRREGLAKSCEKERECYGQEGYKYVVQEMSTM